MKKLLLILMLLMFSSLAMAASVTRDMPSRMLPNEQLTVTLRITDIDSENVAMAIEDTIPSQLSINNWNVQGALGEVEIRDEDNRFGWAFIPEGTTATITYTINLPSQERTYTFGPLTWFDRSGMSPNNAGISDLIVTTQEETTTTTTTTTTIEEPTTTTVQVTTTTMPEEETTTNYLWLVILIALIILVVALYLIFGKKKD